MKILFLTKYPVEGASSRYRVFQYIPMLQELGYECTVSPFMDRAMYETTFSHGSYLGKFWMLASAVVRRLLAARHCREFDIVFMQRELLPFGPLWVERWMHSCGVKLIFDYDDALFIPQSSKFTPLATLLRSKSRIFRIMSEVDCVLAGNQYLADMARPYCDDTRVLEVAEDTERFPPQTRNDKGGLVIGWLGSWTTEQYLETIRGALNTILQKYSGVRLCIVGGGDFQLGNNQVEHRCWSLEEEPALVSSFDIGIMPLPLNSWSLGKSGGKARTYMAAGIPAVCTGIGYNKELIKHGRTGMLVETESEWIDALSTLIENPALRHELGECARDHIAEKFSVKGQSRELARILTEIHTGVGSASA
jgi:glycosyltransferase involved in cell wall biosynthesis